MSKQQRGHGSQQNQNQTRPSEDSGPQGLKGSHPTPINAANKLKAMDHQAQDAYVTFTFSDDNSTITSMVRGNSTNSKELKLGSSTFETTLGINDLGVSAVVSVEETRHTDRFTNTHIYGDKDGDGHYTNSFAINVVASSILPLRQHQFTFNEDDSIASDSVQLLHQSRVDTIDSNEVYQQVDLNGDTYVTKTVLDTLGYHFEIFRDDNADGVWAEIANGHSTADFIDTSNGTVNLVGIQDYLAAYQV